MKSIKIMAVAAFCLTVVGCGNMNNVLSAISNGSVTNAIVSVIGLDKVSASNLIGTWQYNGPGCAFTSENLLAKAGGEVAATKIEQELKPYFDKTGLTSSNTGITFSEDGKFQATISGKSFRSATFAATVTSRGNGTLKRTGFCYATSPNPTLSNHLINCGTDTSLRGSTQALTASTTYYVRAFAENEKGVAYSEQVSFTTDEQPEGTNIGISDYGDDTKW